MLGQRALLSKASITDAAGIGQLLGMRSMVNHQFRLVPHHFVTAATGPLVQMVITMVGQALSVVKLTITNFAGC